MRDIDFSTESEKYLRKLPNKISSQILKKILSLPEQPFPQDSKQLKGNSKDLNYRVDSGEYRIIYRLIDNNIYIVLIGKRNDDEIYKKFKRLN